MSRAFGPTARIAGACICVVLAVVTGACGGKTHDTSVMADGAPSPSPGCARTVAPRSGTASLRYEGIDRSYDIVIPPTRSGEPMPLVLGYHGYAGSPLELAVRLEDRALDDGFVAVFPTEATSVDRPRRTSTSRPWRSRYSPTMSGSQERCSIVSRLTCALTEPGSTRWDFRTAVCSSRRLRAGSTTVSPPLRRSAAFTCSPTVPGDRCRSSSRTAHPDPVVPFDETDVGVPLDATGLFEETAGGSAQLRMLERARERTGHVMGRVVGTAQRM